MNLTYYTNEVKNERREEERKKEKLTLSVCIFSSSFHFELKTVSLVYFIVSEINILIKFR